MGVLDGIVAAHPDFCFVPEFHDMPHFLTTIVVKMKRPPIDPEAFERFLETGVFYAGPQSEGPKRIDPPPKHGASGPQLRLPVIVPPFRDE
ncbi:MAG TPA: hypothetical protein VJP76_07030 [Candidatus Tumulicola sp.]|nr:hypothetical protein [Candidatus Tumulicola sp.]